MTQWEDVEVPAGSFISWGSRAGQHVTGVVLEFAEDGGTDFNGNVCPRISVQLTEKAASINKEGERTDFDKGAEVLVNGGQVRLGRALKQAKPKRGDLIKMEIAGVERTSTGNTLKDFKVKIARGAGIDLITETVSTAASSGGDFGGSDDFDSAPPF